MSRSKSKSKSSTRDLVPGSFAYTLKYKQWLTPEDRIFLDGLKYTTKGNKTVITFYYSWSDDSYDGTNAYGIQSYKKFSINPNIVFSHDYKNEIYDNFSEKYDSDRYNRSQDKYYEYNESYSTIFVTLEYILMQLRDMGTYVMNKQKNSERLMSLLVTQRKDLPREMRDVVKGYLGGRETRKKLPKKHRHRKSIRKSS